MSMPSDTDAKNKDRNVPGGGNAPVLLSRAECGAVGWRQDDWPPGPKRNMSPKLIVPLLAS